MRTGSGNLDENVKCEKTRELGWES